MTRTDDKKHAILLALKEWPDKSTQMVAQQIGVDQQRVAETKKQLTESGNVTFPDRVVGRDGKSYPARPSQKTGVDNVCLSMYC